MQLAFLKMHGAGNKIVVVDQRGTDAIPPSVETLRKLSDPERGPGFDQLMWVAAPQDPSMSASYRVFNADGSEVEQCGNGVRCVAWMLARDNPVERHFRLESLAGPIEAKVLDDDTVTVNMGPPEFEPARIPFAADEMAGRYDIEVGDETLRASVLSMGNPHCVLAVADVATVDVKRLGTIIESHSRFPARTNVGFMQVSNRSNIQLRVFERGVGETLACGSGACAAVVAGRQRGLLDDKVSVQLPGGQLVVSWRGDSEAVWLTGDAELISEGIIDL